MARTVALVLAVVAALLLVLALVTRAPLAWAASVESVTLQRRVSSTAGLLAAGDLPVAEVIVALLAASLCAGALAAWLGYRGWRLRATLGLGGMLERARVLAADDSRLGAPTLRCERLGLVARPDHLMRLADGTVIPVEQKPRARRLYPSHVLELGAQLLVVEARFGRRPPYGLVVLADGAQHRIPFDRSLEDAVVSTLRDMRACARDDIAPGRRWLGAKCRACEFYATCWPDQD